MELSDRLKEIRKTFSLGQQAFAREIGSSQSTVSAFEKGDRKPDVDMVIHICDIFAINIDWLLLGVGPMRRTQGSSASQTGNTLPALPNESNTQHIENIAFNKNKTGNVLPVLEIQQKLTEALQRGLAAQERIASLLEERAELQVALERTRMDMERRDQRIRELEKENAQLRESRKGASPVFRAATGEAN